MLRAFHPLPVPADAQTLTLSAGESFHLVKVLRAGAAEKISAFDGRGNVWTGRALRSASFADDARSLTLAIESRERFSLPACRLALAQALPKGSLAEDIIRAGVEIGLAEFFPLISEHTEVKLDSARERRKLDRWQAIAIEACKQCGNPFLPEIHPVQTAREFFAGTAKANEKEKTLKLTASLEPGARSCHAIAHEFFGEKTASAAGTPEKILWLVGPEGDFSREEYALAREAGFLPVRLGAFVLRVPTAATYCLSVADQMRHRRRGGDGV